MTCFDMVVGVLPRASLKEVSVHVFADETQVGLPLSDCGAE